MPDAVITGGARTAFGRLLGALADFTAADLGRIVIKAALERSGLTGTDPEYVIMGQVLQAGAGQIPARQAAVAAGIPMTVPALTINKVCLSGLDAIALAAQLIRAGEFEIVVARRDGVDDPGPAFAAGSPHRAQVWFHRIGRRHGTRRPDGSVPDHSPMGKLTDSHNARLGIGRAEQDEFAARSHQRAAAAIKDGLLAEEIVAVGVPQRRGETVRFDTDEGVRPDTTTAALSKLRPAFAPDGTITAGSASQISDGACAVVAMSAEAAAARGIGVLAEVGAHGNVAGPDNSLQSQPSRAINHALGKAGLNVADLRPDRDRRGLRVRGPAVHA